MPGSEGDSWSTSSLPRLRYALASTVFDAAVARCEAEIASYETEMADFKSADESIRLAKLLDEHRSQLKEKMAEWEQTSLSLENA